MYHFDEKNFSFESASLVTLSSNRVARHATKKQVSLPLAGTQTWTPKRTQGLQNSSREILKVAVKRSRDSRTRQHPSNVMPHTVVARNTSRRIWTQAQKVATNDKYIRLCTIVKLKWNWGACTCQVEGKEIHLKLILRILISAKLFQTRSTTNSPPPPP